MTCNKLPNSYVSAGISDIWPNEGMQIPDMNALFIFPVIP